MKNTMKLMMVGALMVGGTVMAQETPSKSPAKATKSPSTNTKDLPNANGSTSPSTNTKDLPGNTKDLPGNTKEMPAPGTNTKEMPAPGTNTKEMPAPGTNTKGGMKHKG